MSRLPRVAVPELAAGEQALDESLGHYLTRVLRLLPGNRFIAFDPAEGLEGAAEISRISSGRVTIAVEAVEAARPEHRGSPVPITLVQCLGKGDKPDEVVRAATALGVHRIDFAESERAVVRLDDDRRARRGERWRAIALDAARQSGRANLPEIAPPAPLGDVLARVAAPTALKLLMTPESSTPLRALFDPFPTALVVVIGPEGGFSPNELTHAERLGFQRAKLGALVLRTELATSAVLGALTALCSP